MSRFLVRAVIASVVIAASARAQTTWHVSASVCPSVGSGTPSDPFCKIQDAINAAANEDEVLVAPGSYVETLVNRDKSILLKSTHGAVQTIVTGVLTDNPVLLIRDQTAPFTTVDGFTFRGGQGFWGGGIEVVHTKTTVRNCNWRDNVAERGGGLANFGGDVRLENCLIYDNQATEIGGGLYDDHGFIEGINCTVVNNTATVRQGGVSVNARTILHNSILWGNADPSGTGEEAQTNCGAIPGCVITHSLISGLSALLENGNIDGDPLFADALLDDFHLSTGSPAIDAGDNTQTLSTIVDLDGKPRRVDDPATVDTGVGTPPLVDMGAYEFGGDCNGNGIADADDIVQGTSDDCNANEVPDECEPDCNANGQVDECDIILGVSDDCTSNGIPDECEPDCNMNTTADSCDLLTETSPDCNANSIPDECDIQSGSSSDADLSGVPDECERPVVVVRGSRYVHIAPPPGGETIALYLTSPDFPCLDRFITVGATLDAQPTYLAPASWPHLYVRAAELLPGATYETGVETMTGQRYPAVSFELWGFGRVADNQGEPSFQDITAIIDVFKGIDTVTIYQADMHPCLPNGEANFADVTAAVDAFRGESYSVWCSAPCDE